MNYILTFSLAAFGGIMGGIAAFMLMWCLDVDEKIRAFKERSQAKRHNRNARRYVDISNVRGSR